MFGAARIDNNIKGFHFLREAFRYIIDKGVLPKEDLCLMLFGGIKDDSLLHDFPVHYIYNGYVKGDDTLSMMYSAANCVVSSSLYETFGQTLIEALACGCLPVTFDNSGQTDIVRHRENGYLARWKDPKSLAEGITWAALDGVTDRMELRRDVMERYSESVVARQYMDIYKSMK